MKLEIILAVAWTTLCIGERLQRSTVLTDESKRILEHFDFSNFDKQEGLNYIDRQRYENQIRGKRSHSKSKGRHSDGKEDKFSDKPFEKIKFSNDVDDDSSLTFQISEKSERQQVPNIFNDECSSDPFCGRTLSCGKFRNKRNRPSKKKRKSKKNKSVEEENAYDYSEDEEERRLWKRRRRKRKRRYWDHWSEWSPCSVTCGRGRKIRWRKCVVRSCTAGELEMGEKTCQLPACSLFTKLLGI